MAFFGQKHKLTPLEKNAIFWTFKNSVFQSQKGFFLPCKVTKHLFLVLF